MTKVSTKTKAKRKINSENAWQKNYKELRKFFAVHKHTRVPSHSKDYPQLANWVQKQRLFRKKLSQEQIELLNKLHFVWPEDIRKEKNKRWLLMFKRLEKFKEKNGHCNVPSKYEADKLLGRWVEVVRTRRPYLEDWKIQKLQTIGFKWSEDIQNQKDKHWYTMYRRLEQFYKKYGHSQVPEYWQEDVELSIWVISQRRPKKALASSKTKLLNELKFVWNNNIPLKKKRDNKGRFISVINKTN